MGRLPFSTNSMLLVAEKVRLSTNAGQIVTGSTVSTRHVKVMDGPTLPAASIDHSVTTGASPLTNENVMDAVVIVALGAAVALTGPLDTTPPTE